MKAYVQPRLIAAELMRLCKGAGVCSNYLYEGDVLLGEECSPGNARPSDELYAAKHRRQIRYLPSGMFPGLGSCSKGEKKWTRNVMG